jgi:GNAT superfamily N-acetyltransferase
MSASRRRGASLPAMRIEIDDLTKQQVLALLEHVLQVCRDRGYRELFLETGRHPAFVPAQALYRSVGFRECGPFGDYRENGNSVFMSLRLRGDDMASGLRGISRPQ